MYYQNNPHKRDKTRQKYAKKPTKNAQKMQQKIDARKPQKGTKNPQQTHQKGAKKAAKNFLTKATKKRQESAKNPKRTLKNCQSPPKKTR